MKNTKQNKLKDESVTMLIIIITNTVVISLIFQDFNIKDILTTFMVSALYALVLGFGQMLINHLLDKKYDWEKQTKKRIGLGILSTILYTIPAVLGINYIVFVLIQKGMSSSQFFSKNNIILHSFFILIALLISAILHAKAFMKAWKKATGKEAKTQKIVARTETAKYESLKNQIDPHFLFNSLNVLISLIGEDPKKAEKFTIKLSKIYRYVLEQKNKDLASIQEELNFAKAYIDLLKMRFENAINFDIEENLRHSTLNIIPLSLQLLLENAVKHNAVSSNKPLSIKIFTKDDFLIIENNKNPKDTSEAKSTKIGLQNIKDRYQLLSGKEICIKDTEDFFSVSLPMLA